MPVVNVYSYDKSVLKSLNPMRERLKGLVAEQLTCSDKKLEPGEVTLRVLEIFGGDMMAQVELDIFAAPYQERVERQDEICDVIGGFVLENSSLVTSTRAWLILSELGHGGDYKVLTR